MATSRIFKEQLNLPYPFGMIMPGRSYDGGSGYRYGFNGMEKDEEIAGSGNSYTTEFRQLDTRLARWFSIDPVTHHFQSPYSTMNGNPIRLIDPLGSSATDPSTHIDEEGNVIAEYNDGDDGVYVHTTGTTKDEIDTTREGCTDLCGEVNTDGNGRYIGELGGTLDFTYVFANKLVNSTNQALESDFGIVEWYHMVKGEGDWDLKANEGTIFGVAWTFDQARGVPETEYTRFIYNNLVFTSSADVGNYHAGFTGVMAGIYTDLQIIGAGLVEQKKDASNAEIMQFFEQWKNMPTTFMDEKDDHYWNTTGMADAEFIKTELDLGPNKKLDLQK